MTDQPPSWFVPLRAVTDASHTLLCLPHAGGGTAIFRGMAEHLPTSIDVLALRAPGRENRLSEAPVTSMTEMVAALREQVRQIAGPLSILGYCSGALVGLELTRALAEDGRTLSTLAVAGCPAPSRVVREDGVHQMADPELAEYLRPLGIIPEAVLDDPALLALFAPAIRADYQVFEQSTHHAGDKIATTVLSLGGMADPSTDVESLTAWHQECGGDFVMHLYPGEHTFFADRRAAICAAIRLHTVDAPPDLVSDAGH